MAEQTDNSNDIRNTSALPVAPTQSVANDSSEDALSSEPLTFTPHNFYTSSMPIQPEAATELNPINSVDELANSKGLLNNDVIQPDFNADPTTSHYDEKRRKAKTERKIVPVVAAIIAAAVLGAGYYFFSQNHEHASAFTSCNASYDMYQKSITRLNDTIQNASTIASQITASNVTDPKTVETMNELIKSTQVPGDVQQCNASQSTADIQANDQAITDGIQKMGQDRQNLSNATAAAQTSKYQKDLQDAQVQLTSVLQSAQDHSRRVDMTTQAGKELNQAISDATRVTQSGGDLATLQAAIQSLNDAVAKAPAVR